jgi:hypothetical protein
VRGGFQRSLPTQRAAEMGRRCAHLGGDSGSPRRIEDVRWTLVRKSARWSSTAGATCHLEGGEIRQLRLINGFKKLCKNTHWKGLGIESTQVKLQDLNPNRI